MNIKHIFFDLDNTLWDFERNSQITLLQLIEHLSNGSKLNDVRQLIADNSVSDYSELYRLLYDEVETYGKSNVAECILNIAEAQYQDVNVVDKEINFMSLIIRLLRVIK